jgi:hypothetical protein
MKISYCVSVQPIRQNQETVQIGFIQDIRRLSFGQISDGAQKSG